MSGPKGALLTRGSVRAHQRLVLGKRFGHGGGSRELVGEHISADDRERGALAAERAAVSGVAQQDDSALRVRGQVNGSDVVDVEVGGYTERGEQLGHVPTHPAELGVQGRFLCVGVAWGSATSQARRGGDAGVDEQRTRAFGGGRREQDASAWLAIRRGATRPTEQVGRLEAGDTVTMLAKDVRLETNGDGARGGVQAIGTNHEVKGLGRRALELDGDAVLAVFKARDVVAEAVAGGTLTLVVEQANQVAAQDLDVARHHQRGQRGERVVASVDQPQIASLGSMSVDGVPQLHALEHSPVHGASKVNRLAAFAQRCSALDDDGFIPCTTKPIGHGTPGNAGARDQNTTATHVIPAFCVHCTQRPVHCTHPSP